MLITHVLGDKNLKNLVQLAQAVMNRGGMIIYPTDTVYGLGVDSTNQPAVERIFEIKGRKEGRGIASIFQSTNKIKQWVEVTLEQEKTLRKYLPGPYTFLLRPKANSSLAHKIIDEKQDTVGVRIPNHPFTRGLAKAFEKPFVCTSANISGQPSPKTSAEVEKYLLKPNNLSSPGASATKRYPGDILFIDAGALAGTPSTVVDLTKTPPEVARQGAGEWSRQ